MADYYIKLIVSGGTPVFDTNKTDLEDREYFIVPPPDIVVETKGFGYVVPAEKGGTTSPGRRGGYIKPEG